MNTDSMASGCQQQGGFNFNQPNTTVTQQTPNSGSALDQQNASIRYSTQHPGNNQFVVPARGANLLPDENPGINKPHNRPMGLLQNPEQCLEPPHNLVFNPRFGGTSQGRNSSTLYKKPFKFRPIAPHFNFVANTPLNAFNLNQYNFEFGLSSARQTPTSNVFTFAGPPTFKMESGDSVNNKLNKNQGGLRFTTDKNQPTSQNIANRGERERIANGALEQAGEAHRRLKNEGEKVMNRIRVKHLSSCYTKVRSLSVLCRSFQTPVFGDTPRGNELEKTVLKNLAYFVKDEIQSIKFYDLEFAENRKLTFGELDIDPVLRSGFCFIETVVKKLELKRNNLRKEKERLEMLEREFKELSEELTEREAEAKVLKVEVENEKARVGKLTERLKTERENNGKLRLQYCRELEQIQEVQIHGLHENLRSLQEKITKENNALKEECESLRNLKEQNANLNSYIFDGSREKVDLESTGEQAIKDKHLHYVPPVNVTNAQDIKKGFSSRK